MVDFRQEWTSRQFTSIVTIQLAYKLYSKSRREDKHTHNASLFASRAELSSNNRKVKMHVFL